MSKTFQIVYRSEIKAKSKPVIVSQISDILKEAQERNAREGITGLLTYYDQTFFQVLEGEESAVEDIYSLIDSDSRHHYISLLWKGDVTRRVFPDWSMGYFVPSELDVECKKQLYSFRNLRQEKESILEGPTIAAQLADWVVSDIGSVH